jgi:hypothetical protein
MRDKFFTEICERIDAIEAVVFGSRRGGDLKKAGTDRRIFKREVAIREGCSTKTIERGVASSRYPPPDDIINGRWSWWLSTWLAHDQKRMRTLKRAKRPAEKLNAPVNTEKMPAYPSAARACGSRTR